ncbi:unnamed protein product, partial [Polarella glacialis]
AWKPSNGGKNQRGSWSGPWKSPASWSSSPPALRRAIFGTTNGTAKGLGSGGKLDQLALRKAFREIDKDNVGLISTRELVIAIRRCGIDASRRAVESLLSEDGRDPRGKLGVDEFIAFFRGVESLQRFAEGDEAPLCGNMCGNGARLMLVCLVIAISVMLFVWIRMDESQDQLSYGSIRVAIIGCG